MSVWAVSTCFDSSTKHVTDKNKTSTKNKKLFFIFFGNETNANAKPFLFWFAYYAQLRSLVVKKITYCPFNDGFTVILDF